MPPGCRPNAARMPPVALGRAGAISNQRACRSEKECSANSGVPQMMYQSLLRRRSLKSSGRALDSRAQSSAALASTPMEQ